MEIHVSVFSKHTGQIISTKAQGDPKTEEQRKRGELIVCKSLGARIMEHLNELTTEKAGVISGPLPALVEEASLFTEWLLLGEVDSSNPILTAYKESLRDTLRNLVENPHHYRPEPLAAKIAGGAAASNSSPLIVP
jgi:hypothetical protein